METQKMTIAVVILNWNGKSWLEKFLHTLVKNSKDACIFIADNASTDDSLNFIKKNFPEITIILNKNNNGYAKGYNDALKHIKSDYFVLINSDVEVTEKWLSPIIDLMESNINIAACQPKILDYKNKKKI
jgi:hypothetical protein